MSRYDFEPPEYGGGGGAMPQLQFPRLTPAVKWIMIVCGALQLVQLVVAGRLSDFLAIGPDSFAASRLYVGGLFNLITYQFVHSYGDLFHLLMNMLVLYFFGTMVEEEVGTRRFLRLYVMAGVVGGIFWLLFCFALGRSMDCVGASGACFGVMTYAAFMRPNARVIFIIIFVRLWWLAALFGVVALYQTITALQRGGSGGVADAAHLGGMAFAAFWWRYGKAFAVIGERLEAKAAERERRGVIDREREVDRILAKIKDVGMSGITSRERKFLQKYSQDRK